MKFIQTMKKGYAKTLRALKDKSRKAGNAIQCQIKAGKRIVAGWEWEPYGDAAFAHRKWYRNMRGWRWARGRGSVQTQYMHWQQLLTQEWVESATPDMLNYAGMYEGAPENEMLPGFCERLAFYKTTRYFEKMMES